MENLEKENSTEKNDQPMVKTETGSNFRVVRFDKGAPQSQLEEVRKELGMGEKDPEIEKAAEAAVRISSVRSDVKVVEPPSYFQKLKGTLKRWLAIGGATAVAGGALEKNAVQAEDVSKKAATTYEQKNWNQKQTADVLTPGGTWALEYSHMLQGAPSVENKEEALEFINEAYGGFFDRLNKAQGVALIEYKTPRGASVVIPLKGATPSDWLAIQKLSTQLGVMVSETAQKWQLDPKDFAGKLDQLTAVEQFSLERSKKPDSGKFDFAAPIPKPAEQPKVTYESVKASDKPDLVTAVTEQNQNTWNKDVAVPENISKSVRTVRKRTRPTFGTVSVQGSGTYSASGGSSSADNSGYVLKTVRRR